MRVYADIGPSTAEVLRLIGNGVMAQGMKETVEVYRQLWALGYRPGVPLTFFMRQWAKKKAPIKGPGRSTASAKYNSEQEGEGSVDHRKAPSTMSNISRQ